MRVFPENGSRPRQNGRSAVYLSAIVLCGALIAACPSAGAQDARSSGPSSQSTQLEEAERMAEAALADEADAPDEDAEQSEPISKQPQINMLELFQAGGYLMYPILLMSFLVVMFGAERGLALRRGKVIPRALAKGLKQQAAEGSLLDPRALYRLCIQRRSAAAAVISTALLKIGRPQLEVERAVAESSDREAARLYKNVRPIVLAVTITPLMGLLGTVWGMIQAFFVTASNPVGVNRAESLASGIYQALMTTFAGLAVAIPAAILAHYFEGRIQTLFREIDDLLQGLLPQLARFEGKVGHEFHAKLRQSVEETKPGRRITSPTHEQLPEPAGTP